MTSSRVIAVGIAAAMFVTVLAFGQTPSRVRGTITAINNDAITIKDRNGSLLEIRSDAHTTYAYVVPSSIDAIKLNDFVGSAVKGSVSPMVAVELAIIPEDMRAGRISLYGWDPLPDPTDKYSSMTATQMTNGVVLSIVPAVRQLTTPGIGLTQKEAYGGRTLTITFDGNGKNIEITVPPEAPVVRYILSNRSAVTIGSVVMIKVGPHNRADLVTVGKGVTPPM
jgi:hypothetical protein